MGHVDVTFADDNRDDIEPDVDAAWTVPLQPDGGKLSETLLLTPTNRLGRCTPSVRASGLHFAKDQCVLAASYDIDLALAASEVALEDGESLRSKELCGSIFTTTA